jgi:Rrf2 family nitric oxide-sensitive transcriptional repressor
MITRKTEYAIRTLWELSQSPDSLMTATQIAQKQDIPPKYLPQIVSELCQAGLLNSTRGYGGGVKLGKSAQDISLFNVIEAVQGKPKLFECQGECSPCTGRKGCSLLAIYDRALDAMNKVFEDTRLSDIKINRESRGKND